MRFSTILLLSYLLVGHYIVNAAYIHKTTCTSDLNAVFKGVNTLQASLYRGNIFQARHDYQLIHETVQQAETSCCISSRGSVHGLQSVETLSKQLETFLSTMTTKIRDNKYLLLRVVASMELEQLQMPRILHLDACIASSVSDTDTYMNHTHRIKSAFSDFKTTLLSI